MTAEEDANFLFSSHVVEFQTSSVNNLSNGTIINLLCKESLKISKEYEKSSKSNIYRY